MVKRKIVGMAVLGLLLSIVTGGCSSTHMVYVQEASLGVNLAVGTEGVQKFSLGYDRDIYAIVPKKGPEKDAMSLLSINNAKIEGLNKITVSEFVAGGEPAAKLAKKPEQVNQLRSKIYGK